MVANGIIVIIFQKVVFVLNQIGMTKKMKRVKKMKILNVLWIAKV